MGTGTHRRCYLVVHNPREAKRDRRTREKILARLEQEVAALGDIKGNKYTKLRRDVYYCNSIYVTCF